TTQTGVERRRSAPEGCGEPLETHERARVANSAFGKRSRGGAAFARTYQGSRAAPHGGVQGARTGRERGSRCPHRCTPARGTLLYQPRSTRSARKAVGHNRCRQTDRTMIRNESRDGCHLLKFL